MTTTRADFPQHVQFEVMSTNGRVYSQLLIGTREQIADRVRDSLESALTYGETVDIHLRPIHPVNIAKL